MTEVWEGQAADDEARFRGSSGGAVTALAQFCIERGGSHGVLHTAPDPLRPTLNRTVLSRTREELLAGVGSRYAPAAVCAELGQIENAPGPCVLVGKPCDIAAARMACKIRPKLDANLGLAVSIFCGGTPATAGTLKLLERLGVDPADVEDLRYRGHGWPGMTGVKLKGRDERIEIPYREAWDNILTKHIPFRCRLCPDGTGQFADIACGDPWYRPIQPGEKGSTLILIRTPRGRQVLHDAMKAGYIIAEPRPPEVLPLSQAGLLNRRRHVWPKLVALRAMGLPCPRFEGFSLFRNWLRLPLGRKFVSFWHAFRYAYYLRRKGPVTLDASTIAPLTQAPTTR